MPCSLRSNDCCRGETTFLNMTYFLFNGAPGERAVPEGFVTCPVCNPHWTGSLTDSAHGPRVAGRDGAMTHINRECSTVGQAPHLLTSHTVHYNPAQVPCRVTRSDRPEMVHKN
jgi:hypothetical protein